MLEGVNTLVPFSPTGILDGFPLGGLRPNKKPVAFGRASKATGSGLPNVSIRFGSPAIIAQRVSSRPMALRPHLSMGLPLSADIQLIAHNMPLHTPFIVSIGPRWAWVNGKVVPVGFRSPLFYPRFKKRERMRRTICSMNPTEWGKGNSTSLVEGLGMAEGSV